MTKMCLLMPHFQVRVVFLTIWLRWYLSFLSIMFKELITYQPSNSPLWYHNCIPVGIHKLNFIRTRPGLEGKYTSRRADAQEGLGFNLWRRRNRLPDEWKIQRYGLVVGVLYGLDTYVDYFNLNFNPQSEYL